MPPSRRYPPDHEIQSIITRPERASAQSGVRRSRSSRRRPHRPSRLFTNSIWQRDLDYGFRDLDLIRKTSSAEQSDGSDQDDAGLQRTAAALGPARPSYRHSRSLSASMAASLRIEGVEPDGPDAQATQAYHIFTRQQKTHLVLMVSLAAVFSPLSSNIYFPALVTISQVRLTLSP